MCIFSGHVAEVNSTNIFCREMSDNLHVTVYEMRAAIPGELAMILPVPVLRNSGDAALTFLNLEKYPNFFGDMKKLFPEPMSRGRLLKGLVGVASADTLVVHDVGNYVASFVPTLNDLDRLDARFKLPRTIWEMLPNYRGWGFAVFQLKPGRGKSSFHPMAYKYPPQDNKQLFYPTVHVHDGKVPKQAGYDHNLYFQTGGQFAKVGWEEGSYKPADKMNMDLTLGIVDPQEIIERLKVYGKQDNHDHLLTSANQGLTNMQYNQLRAAS